MVVEVVPTSFELLEIATEEEFVDAVLLSASLTWAVAADVEEAVA